MGEVTHPKEPLPRSLSSVSGLFILLLCYAGFHIILRLSFSGNVTTDDAQALLLVQAFQTGYQIHQPPLYEWLLYATQQLFGVSLLAALILKYALLGIAAFSLYGAGIMVMRSSSYAVLAVCSYLAFYQIGWNLLEGSTHTVAVISTSALTLFAAMLVLKRADFWAYVLFGIALGLGLLSKFSFGLFALALTLNIIALPSLRHRIKPSLLALSLIIALVIISPYAFWLSSETGIIEEIVDKMSAERRGLSELLGLQSGIKAILNAGLYSLIFLPLFLLIFWRNLRFSYFTSPDTRDKIQEDFMRFLGLLFILGVGIVILAAFVGGISNIKERHFHPFFLPLPLILFAALSHRNPNANQFRWFKLGLLSVIVGVALVRAITLAFPYETVCGRCREMIPYDLLAQSLPNTDQIPVIAVDLYTAANLTIYRGERVVLAGEGQGEDKKVDQCLVVWRVFEQTKPDRRVRILEKVIRSLELRDLNPEKARIDSSFSLFQNSSYHPISWQTPFQEGFRVTEWRSKILENGAQCSTLLG